MYLEIKKKKNCMYILFPSLQGLKSTLETYGYVLVCLFVHMQVSALVHGYLEEQWLCTGWVMREKVNVSNSNRLLKYMLVRETQNQEDWGMQLSWSSACSGLDAQCCLIQEWPYRPATTELRRQRQRNQTFKVIFNCKVSSRPAWAKDQEKQQKNKFWGCNGSSET